MKLPEQPPYTVGVNTPSLLGLSLLWAVMLNLISPWWLLLAAPSMFCGFGLEIHQKKTINNSISL